MRIIIRDVTILDGNRQDQCYDGYVIVNDGRFEQFAVGECLEANDGFDDVVSGKGKLLLPGLINTHGHAAMSLLRGYADDIPLQSWLQERIWPAEDLLTAEDIHIGTQLAMLEMIETGTTTFTDMYFHMDRVAEAVVEAGMRAVLGRGLIGIAPNAADALAEGEAFVREYQGAGNGRITTTFAPHAPYTCPPDFLRTVGERAAISNATIQIHLAETAGEDTGIRREYGISPTAMVAQTGLFEHRVIAAHCVHLSEVDLDLLAQRGVHVAHNPGSNLKLGSGIAPLPGFLSRNIKVGLGTDGAASNNKLDMYEEMRLAALLHKGTVLDASVVAAASALHLATAGGACALHLPDGLGQLLAGAPADFQLIDISGPRYQPRRNLLAHVVYSSHGGDVTHVYVAGKALYRNRQFTTIDAERVLAEVNRLIDKFPGH